ncbi:MAG: hypothetical protein Q9226_005517 [Calogaya cf. arnoldii]
MFRISDTRVNATHIFRLLGRTRTGIAKYRDTLSPQAYVTLRGHARYQGTYVDLLTAMELCQQYELHMLEEQLRTLTPVIVQSEAEPIGGVQGSETENREMCSDSAAASSSDSEDGPRCHKNPIKQTSTNHPALQNVITARTPLQITQILGYDLSIGAANTRRGTRSRSSRTNLNSSQLI